MTNQLILRITLVMKEAIALMKKSMNVIQLKKKHKSKKSRIHTPSKKKEEVFKRQNKLTSKLINKAVSILVS